MVSRRVPLRREQTAKAPCLLCSLEKQMGDERAPRRIRDRFPKSYSQIILRGELNINGAVGPIPVAGTYCAQCAWSWFLPPRRPCTCRNGRSLAQRDCADCRTRILNGQQ